MVRNPLDVCDTSLVLGLGHAQRSVRSPDLHRRQNPPFKPNPSLSHRPPLEPSLALRPPLDAYRSAPAKAFSPAATLARQQSSSHSTVSSFSKAGSEGAERASSRASDDDEEEEEEEGSARKKLRLTKEQSALLEDRFKEHSTLNPKQKQALAKQLSLRPRQVEVWFQNRRARTKMKQTEVDCEILRRCCETLTDENRRLQKELRELKAITLGSSPPWMMQFPGATLAVCPSCERAAVAGDGSTVGVAAIAKPQLYNPFTRPAAC